MWQEHLHSTLRGLHLQQLKSDRCMWVKANIMVLASVDDLLVAGTSRETSLFLEQLRQLLSLKHSKVLTTQQPLRFLGKRICGHPDGDITVSLERFCYYSMLKHMDLDSNSNPTSTVSLQTSSTTRCTTGSRTTSHLLQSRWNAHLGIIGTSRPPVTAKDHTRHLTAPTEWGWTHLKHTLRYIKGTLHYRFLISPRLPQEHSLPLRQLIPLHVNTYCDSDWATDIESRKFTSRTVTSVLGVPLV